MRQHRSSCFIGAWNFLVRHVIRLCEPHAVVEPSAYLEQHGEVRVRHVSVVCPLAITPSWNAVAV